MTAVAYLRREQRTGEALLGLATLAPLPLLLLLPGWMLASAGAITQAAACPGGVRCSPFAAERVRAVVEVLTVWAPPIAAGATVAAVLWLLLARRRAWPVGLLGLAITAAVVIAGIELHTVNAAPV
ncbi:hypothetical protein OVA14_05710 [Agrococcus sp. SL85]|uniref:hypothetical protein n=1 Tax=Agrococcus sp. SL85 TaxID=2995141 RepID=UPI00226D1678|nr:hypothetical protein [Agrococcus sp. SL85]WAC67233.1 hypothetical protein OVA14_05710 [Agrococcus sp. SL85]